MRARGHKNYNHLLRDMKKGKKKKSKGKNATMRFIDKIDEVVNQDEQKKVMLNNTNTVTTSENQGFTLEDTLGDDFNQLAELAETLTSETPEVEVPVLKEEQETIDILECDTEEIDMVTLKNSDIKSMEVDEKLLYASMQGLEILSLLQEVEQKFQEIQPIFDDFDKIKGEANAKADTKVGDIYHAIEFYNFNASEGYKLSKLLKTNLQKRRAVKHSEKMVYTLLDIQKNLKNSFKISSKYTKELEIQPTYSPRNQGLIETYTKKMSTLTAKESLNMAHNKK